MKVIILNKTDYQDKDIIVQAISDSESLSFKLRGGQLPTSAFYFLNNPLTIADIEYVENVRYKHQIVKGAKLIDTPFKEGQSIKKLLAVSYALELVNRAVGEEEKHLMFSALEKYVSALNKIEDDDYLLIMITLMAHALNVSGFSLDVDKCLHCGKRNSIVAFSFSEGGFLCRDCYSNDIPNDLSPVEMRLLRYTYKNKEFALFANDFSLNDKKEVITKLHAFLTDALGININSLSLYLKEN